MIINVICTPKSWLELLRKLPEQLRFSDPGQYDQELLETHGRSLYISYPAISPLDPESTRPPLEFHVYPPQGMYPDRDK